MNNEALGVYKGNNWIIASVFEVILFRDASKGS
jgi:hypothetical protein